MRPIALAALLLLSTSEPGPTGVLLLAHGGSDSWNQNVRSIADAVNHTMPTEVAFGMATRSAIQEGVDRLTQRGVSRIVAVPLFISSHSSIITSTEYLLGLRNEMPADLKIFARMGADHAHHADERAASRDGTLPVRVSVPVSMTPALDAHPVVAAIVTARAASIARDADREAVILIGHGPNDDASNEKWLANLRAIGHAVGQAGGYRSVDAVTIRDDAPPEVRKMAVGGLRDLVKRRSSDGRVLVVPVVLSFGGIEARLRGDLDGLAYTMTSQGLAPDPSLVTWVLQSVAVAVR